MAGQPGFFDVDERLKELSAKGDALERLSAVVDFDLFRTDLERAVVRSDRSRGGRPPFDHVLMFKVLILQSSRRGLTSPPSCARRTETHAGRSNTPKPNRTKRGGRASIWRFLPSAIKTISASIADIV